MLLLRLMGTIVCLAALKMVQGNSTNDTVPTTFTSISTTKLQTSISTSRKTEHITSTVEASTVANSTTSLPAITTSNATSETNEHSTVSSSSPLSEEVSTSLTTSSLSSTTAHKTASSTATSSTTITTTTTTTPSTTTTTSSKAAVVAPAVIVPLAVLAIVAVVLYFNWDRLKKTVRRIGGESPGSTSSGSSLELPPYTSLVVPVEEFLNYCEDMEKECDFKYAQQFESLQLVGREQPTEQALLKCNVEKNRYINIHPYDITRVKLLPVESEEGTDYINASWIPGYYSKREYIAAQGPLPSTEDDMWRMMWEYNCKGIIMLTKCMEGGRKKCDQYWPEDNEPVVYGDIQVILVGETSEDEKWTIKKLELSMGQHKRTLKLFHFIHWPDNGVPESPEVLLQFMEVVRKELDTTRNGPLVIHCSAGVGRTGTYIAIETLLQQLENERQVDIFGVIYRLRLNRVFMVQTECQYKFIHETVGYLIREKYSTELQNVTSHEDNNLTLFTNGGEDIPLQVKVDANNRIGTDNKAFEVSSQT